MPLAFPAGISRFQEPEDYFSDGSPAPAYPPIDIAIDPAILAEDFYARQEVRSRLSLIRFVQRVSFRVVCATHARLDSCIAPTTSRTTFTVP